MNRQTIENILNFLKEKEGQKIPYEWVDSKEKFKLIEELENYPDGTQYRYNDHLYLWGIQIKKLPNNLHVSGFLDLSYSNIPKLPDKLYVRGYFNLDGCKQITELPNNLQVGGDLVLHGTNITELPNNLYVGIDLYIGNTPLADEYTDEEIIKIVESTRGQIEGKIIRE
jgi:hypothetical protein